MLPQPEWRQVIIACMREIEGVGRATPGVGRSQRGRRAGWPCRWGGHSN